MYTKPLAQLIEAFQRLPGIGPKSAQRLAFFILKQKLLDVEQFAHALLEAKRTIVACQRCFNLTNQELCDFCTNTNRDQGVICVVPEPQDLHAVEKTGDYRGLYHILGGLISPIQGVGVSDLKIDALLRRMDSTDSHSAVSEVILALPPCVEGDTTSLYLTRLLKPYPVKLSRIAFGIPVGGELEYVDSLTLSRALMGRIMVS